MPTNASDREPLLGLGRRFAWMTLVSYAALTAGLWLAAGLFAGTVGAVTDYTVGTSLIGAITFRGLYAAAIALRGSRRERSVPM